MKALCFHANKFSQQGNALNRTSEYMIRIWAAVQLKDQQLSCFTVKHPNLTAQLIWGAAIVFTQTWAPSIYFLKEVSTYTMVKIE